MKKMKMPVGVDDFEDFRQMDYYYVDKTGLIKELLDNLGKVNLFTRPRRFGKSINMSMLRYFFEIGTDKKLFNGLAISRDTGLCEEYMGQYPVISLTLKQVSGPDYETAKNNLWEPIMDIADHFGLLLESEKLSGRDKNNLQKLCDGTGNLEASLRQLSAILYRYYGKKVIILIDEYDAPLQKAYENGYYNEMTGLIRQMFGYALKSNEYMYFSVLTGCMRISKESIFSDLNNPTLYTLADDICDEWFGFTDAEVRKLLKDMNLTDYYGITKDWYDGYRIGETDIYCPWDVVNWCRQLLLSADKEPKNYWANVSENNIVYQFVEMADETTRHDLEILSEGKCVDKHLSFELTYRDITSSIDNLWSVLYTTGYLTGRGRNQDGSWHLAIPNREVRNIFSEQIKKWFLNRIESGLQKLYQAFDTGRAEEIERCMNVCLRESVSFMDGGNSEEQKEAYYHGLMIGMMKGRQGWVVKSNREAGKGRADIILIDRINNEGLIIEVKHADQESRLEERARAACLQIETLNYDEFFEGMDIRTITKYGISFCGKKCSVLKL